MFNEPKSPVLDDDRLRALAERVGVPEPQARALLEAAGVEITRPAAAPATPLVATPLMDGAAWAAGFVVVTSVLSFISMQEGLDRRPPGKGGLLAVALLLIAAAFGVARGARSRGYTLGVQLAYSVAAILTPLAVWSAVWVLGLWPGHAVTRRGPDWSYTEWSQGSEAVRIALGALVSLSGVAAAVTVLRRTGAGLAWGWAVFCVHLLVTVPVWAGDWTPDWSDATLLAISAVYSTAAVIAALALEPRRRTWATWTWPYAWWGLFATVVLTAEITRDGIGWALGAAITLAIGVGAVLLRRGQMVLVAGIAGILLEGWLYSLADLNPPAALALSLLLGLGIIGLALAALRWRARLIALLPESVAARVRRLTLP